MKAIYQIVYLLLGSLMLLVSCKDDSDLMIENGDGEFVPRIVEITPEAMPLIETRASEKNLDSELEHVILYVFDESGKLVNRYKEDFETSEAGRDGNTYKLKLLLPPTGNYTFYAVGNYPDLWNNETIKSPADLDKIVIEGHSASCAFPGYMIMTGKEKVDLSTSQKVSVHVSRIAAKIDFTVSFQPVNKGDEFYLSNATMYNIPLKSNLFEKTIAQTKDRIPNETGDAVYTESNTQEGYYLQKEPLKLTETEVLDSSKQPVMAHKALFYLFENRRGGEKDLSDYETRYGDNKDAYQALKGEKGRKNHPLASYIKLEGIYKTAGVRAKVEYVVYLGRDNFSDFNVDRNGHYDVKVTIRAVDVLDTRVDAVLLSNTAITSFFNLPLDAHYGVARCYGYAGNSQWELYVEEPDKHPWLELSFSSEYKPRMAGQSVKPEDRKLYAGTYFNQNDLGGGALSSYFYIHVDEFIPETGGADNESVNMDKGKNVAEDEAHWRTGAVILYDRVNGSYARFEVLQRPAQLVVMPVKDVLGNVKQYNRFYVEYELENNNLQWGFLQYPANPVMTSMINDRWDGLANTRRLYQEAIKKGGAYNNRKFPPQKEFSTPEEAARNLPKTDMIGYVMGKNRDRNGNGCIDYDEIEWYVPASDELLELWKYMNDSSRKDWIKFQSSEERFHSSTPYLAGYTYEIPGRAFYVKTKNGKKVSAFTMRNRVYNVVCCRRAGAWMGKPDGIIEGDVSVDQGWNTDEGGIIPKNN